MNKKHFNFITAMLVCIILALPVLLSFNVKADGQGMVEPVLTVDGYLFPIVDAADLLTDDEENALASHIYDVEDQFQSAIVMVTVDTLGTRTVEEYGDDFYDYNGYGFGETHDGIIFLLAMDSREWHIGTTGTAIRTYTDSDQEEMIDACIGNLSSGNYYLAFDSFITECEHQLMLYRNG